MLLQPFFCALILARQWHWSIPVALAAVLTAFLMREPLVVLARQKKVWRENRPETAVARRWLLWESAILVAAGLTLLARWPWVPAIALGGGAVLLTWLAVIMTVRNLQRSAWLQVFSAAGLTATCLAASLSTTGRIESWCWLLWALSAAHAMAGIFVVHSRLEARIAARTQRRLESRFRRPAYFVQFLLLAGAIALRDSPLLAGALGLSAVIHLADLWSLKRPDSLNTPLTRVGIRAMTLSFVFSALVVSGLW